MLRVVRPQSNAAREWGECERTPIEKSSSFIRLLLCGGGHRIILRHSRVGPSKKRRPDRAVFTQELQQQLKAIYPIPGLLFLYYR